MMSTATSVVMQESHNNWKQQCQQTHRPEQGRKTVANHAEATRETEFLCSMKEEVCIEDQTACKAPLDTMIGKPIGAMKSWLRNWRDVLPASAKQAEESTKANTKAVHKFMKDPENPEKHMDR